MNYETLGTFSDMPQGVRIALNSAFNWASENRTSNQANALVYIDALPDAIMTYGARGLRVQLLYIINNLSTWRGADARYAKHVLKNYVKELSGTK